MSAAPIAMPARGLSDDEILQLMTEAARGDAHWREGRVWALVFDAGHDVTDLLKRVYGKFFHENALNPSAFPSLRKFETEVVSMAAALLGGDAEVVGNITSGGTESILLAVKTARDWARKHRPWVRRA